MPFVRTLTMKPFLLIWLIALAPLCTASEAIKAVELTLTDCEHFTVPNGKISTPVYPLSEMAQKMAKHSHADNFYLGPISTKKPDLAIQFIAKQFANSSNTKLNSVNNSVASNKSKNKVLLLTSETLIISIFLSPTETENQFDLLGTLYHK